MINSRVLGEWQEQIADRLRKGQETMTAAFRTWARTAQSAKPQLPNVSVPKVKLPDVTARIPSPKAVVTSTFDLAEQLLAAQRKLAEQAADAAAPLLGRPATARRPGSVSRSAPAAADSEPGDPAAAKARTTAHADTTVQADPTAGADPAGPSAAAPAGPAKSGTAAKSRAPRATAKRTTASGDTPGSGADATTEPTRPDAGDPAQPQ
jgi:hypothetical protein